MSSDAIKFEGLVLTWNGQAVAEIVDINGPNEIVTSIDTTHNGSTSKDKLPGLHDGGQVTLTLNFVPGDTGQDNLYTDFHARTERTAVITHTDTGALTETFTAFIVNMGRSGSVDNKITQNVTFEVVGVPVRA